MFLKSYISNSFNLCLFFDEPVMLTNYYWVYLICLFYFSLLTIISIYYLNKTFQLTATSKTKLILNQTTWFTPSETIFKVILYYLMLIFFTNISATNYMGTVWYTHLIVGSLQIKFALFILISFSIIYIYFNLNFIFLNQPIFDFVSITVILLTWILILYHINNLFVFVFLLEIITITLLLLTSSSYFYSNTSIRKINHTTNLYLVNNIPYYQVSSVVYLFWVSFLTSVCLFFFILLFFYNLLTFDFNLLAALSVILSIDNGLDYYLGVATLWFIFNFCIFLKCGLTPFFIWKPHFFKGLSYTYLVYYILFYYFFILLFLVYFFTTLVFEFYVMYVAITVFLTLFGLVVLFCFLYNVTYVKTFLAVSSVLNTLIVFFSINSYSYFNLVNFI